MDGGPFIDVTTWKNSSPLVVTAKLQRRKSLSPALFGLLGTIVLHAMIFQAVGFSIGMPLVHKADSLMPVGQTVGRANEPGLVLIDTISRPAPNESQTNVAEIAALNSLQSLKQLRPEPVRTLEFDSLPLDENESLTQQAAGADALDSNRLLGIYVGQIQARIMRAWRRPRTKVDDAGKTNGEVPSESFQCEAQIIQDPKGYVQEVLLPRCNESSTWKQSLLAAIRQASPFPVPPDTVVVTRSITLSFVGVPYSRDEPEDDYETEPESVARIQ